MVVAAPCQHLAVVGPSFSPERSFSFGNLRKGLRSDLGGGLGTGGSTQPELAQRPTPAGPKLGIF
jgi:hypothetical protein